MQADVLDVLWSKLCFLESHRNRTRRLFRRITHAHTMKRFASRSVAADLSVDFCSPGASMIVVLQHKHPRTLGENKPIAVSRKRSRCPLRLIVPRLCQGPDHGVTLHDSFRDGRVHAASDEHRLHTSLDVLIGVTESIR